MSRARDDLNDHDRDRFRSSAAAGPSRQVTVVTVLS